MRGPGEQESIEGVALTNLDQPLFDGSEATKRDLVEYLAHRRLVHVREANPLGPGQEFVECANEIGRDFDVRAVAAVEGDQVRGGDA